MDDNKCAHCKKWVDCGAKGFCLAKDLFTYTELPECSTCLDYVEGEPITEDEFEEAQWF